MSMYLLLSMFVTGCQSDPIQEEVEEIARFEEPLVCLEAKNYDTESVSWSAVAEESGESHQAEFSVSIDSAHEAWQKEGFHLIEEPVEITGLAENWEVVAAVKELRATPDLIRLDLYISPKETGLRDIVLRIENDGNQEIRDYRVDPWAAPAEEREFHQKRIVQDGYMHFAFGLDRSGTLALDFSIEGTADTKKSQASSPIALSPDAKTLWSVFHDSVASIVLEEDQRTNYSIPGKPTSVVVTHDNRYALTVSPQCNQVIVIDTESQSIVQILDEENDNIAREPREIILSPSGDRAYVSSYVGDMITVLQRTENGFVVEDQLSIGRRPTGMSLSPDGKYLFVAHYLPRGPIGDNESWISTIDTEQMSVVREIGLRDQFNLDRAACVQQIEIFSSWTAEDLSIEGVPKMLAGIFLDPSGNSALVPGLKSPGFPALEGDISSWGVGQTRKGANNPAVLYPLTFVRDQEGEVLPWQLAQDVIDTAESFLKCALPTNDIEFVTPREASVLGEAREELFFYPGTITPGAQTPFMPMGLIESVGYTRGGRRILALSSVADMVAVLDGATHQSAFQNHLTLSGSNPVGIAISPDGKRGYVAYRNSPFVSVLDLETFAQEELPKPIFTPFWLQDTSQVAVSLATRQTFTRDMSTVAVNPSIAEIGQLTIVDEDPLPVDWRRGKILFESSNPEKYPGLSGHPHASCASCHPAGGSDGSAWGTVEGERRTNSLRGGIAGRGWLHYSATHSNIDEFLEVVLPERLGGTGLNEKDHEYLSAYIAYGIPTLQAPKTDPEMVAQGKEIFAQNCVACHQGDTYSSGNPDPEDEFGGAHAGRDPFLYDIGTHTDRAGVILGPPFAAIFPEPAGSILRLLSGDRTLGEEDIVEDILKFQARPNREAGLFKAPSLTNIWDEPLLLHNGSFTDLGSLISYKARFFSFEISESEQEALLAYLKTL